MSVYDQMDVFEKSFISGLYSVQRISTSDQLLPEFGIFLYMY